MKIRTLEYHDNRADWHLNPVDFSADNLTLLVGVSGVGKTLILESIMNLKEIAEGESLNGVKWNVTFSAENGLTYCWEGEFETKKERENETEQFKIIYEKLTYDQLLIVERKFSDIILKGKETPKLSPFQSVITILNLEEVIEPIYKAFKTVIYSGTYDPGFLISPTDSSFKDMLITKDMLKMGSPLKFRLFFSYKNDPETFEKIKQHFIEIFPYAEDIKVEPDRKYNDAVSFWIQIKEKGIMNWIEEHRISSGMLRVLRHLMELYLLPEGSVILIDEFENSLGINCIDALTENLSQDRDLQFIITSHHPYIINNIAMEHWKIVTRKGNTVTVRDASDFKLGKTKHSAFMELLQLEEYSDGIQ